MSLRPAEPEPPRLAADRVHLLLDWFDREGRPWPWRATRNRWHVLVAEVCLQQTQVSRAAGHVEQLVRRYPTPADMAAAPLGDVLALWQGLGYPRRARNLHLSAKALAATGWPEDYTTLPGVGPYTAAALRCFADEEPVVPPDINTRRVFGRLFSDGVPDHTTHPRLRAQAWAWGQAVMELGQRTCRARARCWECPLQELCPSAGTEQVVASPRQARYEGSMRQRRGVLLKAVTSGECVPRDRDGIAADSLLAEGLLALDNEGVLRPPM